MDLETENRIAAILLKEAEERRREAEKEGVFAYLRQPKARARPNSRFLTATVLGVQQANRAVEVNEMWRARQKELELDKGPKRRLRDDSTSSQSQRGTSNFSGSSSRRYGSSDEIDMASHSRSRKMSDTSYSREEEGLRDEELEKFLQSRTKRGRGSVGSRMDETGPYLSPSTDSGEHYIGHDVREHRVVLGPEKPLSHLSDDSSDEEIKDNRKKKAKVHSGSSDKRHSKRHRSKEKSRDKKKKRKEEKRSKHRK